MTDLDKTLFKCAEDSILSSANEIIAVLPPDLAKRFSRVVRNYLARFGPAGACERMNNRTLSQIFAGFDNKEMKELASGEVDGVGYQLYEAPNAQSTDTCDQNT